MGSLHARVVSQSAESHLACVIDPDPEAGRALADRYDGLWFPDVDSLDGFDAIIVAAPTPEHVAWAERALDAGKPVLVEKPVAEDSREVERLVDRARRTNTPMMCGLLERFNPAVMTVSSIVEEPIHIATVRHSPFVQRARTGVVFDLLIHDVDLVLRMARAMPEQLTADFGYAHPKSEPGTEDVAEATLAFPTGLLASLSAKLCVAAQDPVA